MRILAIGLIALALGGCVQREPRDGEHADACAHTATHAVTWSNETRPDTISVRSDGPTCKQAVVTFTVRNAEGDPLWAFSTTFYDMTSGGIPPEGAPAATAEQMQTFLAGWADATVARSGALPEWTADAASLADSVTGLAYSTPFEREAYEALRGRNLREICYAAAVEATQCLVIDPGSNAPTMIVAYGR